MIFWNDAASAAVRCRPNEPAMASSWSVVGVFTDMVIGPPPGASARQAHHALRRAAGKAAIGAVVGPLCRRYHRRRPAGRRPKIRPRESPRMYQANALKERFRTGGQA